MPKLSPAIFGIALICFLLPWVNISCQGQKVMSFTGMNLVTGTTINEPNMFGPAKQRRINGDIFAVLAFCTVIAGGLVSFAKGKKGNTGPTVSGAVGAVLLLLFKSNLDDSILKQSQGVLQVNYDIGFYLTLLSFLAAVGLNAYPLMQSDGFSSTQSVRQESAPSFCNQCGAKVEPEGAFCSECGHSLK